MNRSIPLACVTVASCFAASVAVVAFVGLGGAAGCAASGATENADLPDLGTHDSSMSPESSTSDATGGTDARPASGDAPNAQDGSDSSADAAGCDGGTSASACGPTCSPCPGLGATTGGQPNDSVTCAAGGQCTFACLAGYADCDGNMANGCEANITDDPANCGACGHSCAVPYNDLTTGPTCSPNASGDAVCSPAWILRTELTTSAAPIIVDTDGSSVVFAMENQLLRLTPEALPFDAATPVDAIEWTATANGSDIIGGLATDATNYYLAYAPPAGTDAGADMGGINVLVKTSSSSATPTPLYSGIGFFGLAIGGTDLYASDYTSFSWMIPLPSGAATAFPAYCSGSGVTLRCDSHHFGVAADANGAFLGVSDGAHASILSWSQSSPGVPSAAFPAKLPLTVDTGASAAATAPYPMALDADNLYWGDDEGNVMQAARGSGTPVALAAGQGTITGITVAGGYVYWATGAGTTGTVNRVPVGVGDAGAATVDVLASGETAAAGAGQPWGVAVVPAKGSAPAYVYWTTLAGNVRVEVVW